MAEVDLHAADVDRAAVAGERLRVTLRLGLARVLDIEDALFQCDWKLQVAHVEAADKDAIDLEPARGAEEAK